MVAETDKSEDEEVEAILAAVADGLIVYGARSEVRRADETARALLGLAATAPGVSAAEQARLAGMTDARGRPLPAERTPAGRALGGEVVRGELVAVGGPDGRARWLSCNARPIRRADGALTGAVVTVMQVSGQREHEEERDERKGTHEALHRSEEQRRLALNAADLGTWGYDLRSGEVFWDERFRAIFGVTASQMTLAQALDMLLHPDDRQRVSDAIDRALHPAGDGAYEIEYRIRWPDDSVRWIAAKGQAFFEGEGESRRAVRFLGTAADITPRKRVEAALRESEERFRDLANNISQLAWMADENGRIGWYNQRWFDYTGTTLAAMQGQGWQKVHHPDHVGRVVEKIQRCFERGEVWEDTFPLRGRDGSYRWFLSRAVPIRDETGKVLRWFGTNTDVTEQREAAARAARHRGQVEAVFQAVQDGIVVADMTGHVVLVNHTEAVRHGLATDAVAGRDLAFFADTYELYLPDGRLLPIAEGPLARVLRGESISDWELRARQRDTGREWYFSFSGEPARNERGEQILAVLITRDITERKRSEQARQQSEARFRQLADSMPQLVWTADPDGKVDYYNERRREFCGIQRVAAESWDWAPVVHPDDLDATLEAWQRAVATGMKYEIEHRVLRADGSYGWYLSRGLPVRDGDGRILKWYGTATDIDELKRVHQELRAKEEALLEADRRKNEFLAILSHELRNPLAPIRNSVYILERAAPGGDQARRAQRVIDRQVTHMTRLIDDLLDVTRISRGKIHLRRERLDLEEVVRRTVEDLRSVFVENDIELAVTTPGEPVIVEGDATRLAQIVGNLLQNAAKFTPRRGHAHLTVTTDGGAHAVIRVRDDGGGIAPDVLPLLFEPFMQADKTLDRSKGGLGLGLALVKGLVELHGGSVSAHSEGLGKGAEFVVRLPHEAPAIWRRQQAPRDAPSAARRVLLIEDNADAAETLKDALGLNDHVVEVAGSGAEGLEKAHRFAPDVVLCDIGLPGMDGYEVARAIRADPQLRSVWLVALSGYALPDDVERAKAAGFDRHLAKPPDLDTLERVLTERPAKPAAS